MPLIFLRTRRFCHVRRRLSRWPGYQNTNQMPALAQNPIGNLRGHVIPICVAVHYEDSSTRIAERFLQHLAIEEENDQAIAIPEHLIQLVDAWLTLVIKRDLLAVCGGSIRG